jgi:hypothetical protein
MTRNAGGTGISGGGGLRGAATAPSGERAVTAAAAAIRCRSIRRPMLPDHTADRASWRLLFSLIDEYEVEPLKC